LNDYEPTLQETLQTVSGLSVTAASTVEDTVSLIDSAEDLLKRSGSQLDSGTKQTLESLAAVLRRTANVMSTSGSIQNSKNAMTDIIEDLWNDHTGDVDNLLLMDATAQAESLTDPRNGTPQSVQVLIRTQEIKVEDEETAEETAKTAEKSTFLGRIAQMFKDLWAAITGIFH
jgi:putative membrane protein